MLKTRMKNAVEYGWEIGPGYRGELMPMPYVVKFFAERFLPLGEAVYEKRKPNPSSIEDALLRLHIPAHHEHPFRTNVNTYSGST